VQQYNAEAKEFQVDNTVGLFITVDQIFDNDHRIVSQKGESKGRYTFTAGESGEHKLCFSPTNWKAHAGYLKNGQEVGGVRVSLDMVVGATSNIESTDHGKILDMVSKVRDLQGRLQDIRREQVFQRVSPHRAVQVDTNGYV
jgi:p24 family protein alpha